MPINRLLAGRNFSPESLKLIKQAFELALERLHIGADDEAAKLELAKLILDIAAHRRSDPMGDVCALRMTPVSAVPRVPRSI
jgi:hypothetical protein